MRKDGILILLMCSLALLLWVVVELSKRLMELT